jgi:hypothetical protein
MKPAAATIIRVMGGWNAAKQQAGLDTNPSTGSRVSTQPAGVDLPDDVEWADLSANQRWHYTHVSKNTNRTLVRRARLRAWVYEYKREQCQCSRCGESHPACLDFHHQRPTEKHLSISKMVSNGYALSKIKAEIEICDVLCANCHRKEHHQDPRSRVDALSSESKDVSAD